MLAHSQEPFFVAPRPLWPRQVCAVAGLPAAAAPGRCARSQALATVHRPAQAQRAAGPNGWQGGGLALAPYHKPHGVYFFTLVHTHSIDSCCLVSSSATSRSASRNSTVFSG